MAHREDIGGRGAWDDAAASLDGDPVVGWNLRNIAKRARVAVTWRTRYMRLKKKYLKLKRSRG